MLFINKSGAKKSEKPKQVLNPSLKKEKKKNPYLAFKFGPWQERKSQN